MAITSSDTSCDKIPPKSLSSAHSSKHSCRLLKLNFGTDSSISSATSKCSKPKINNIKCRSPYLTGDRIQLLSRVVEKRFVHKTNIVSSFPLAANLYKTNSDDFKALKKGTKKVKKSVLTLPNDPAPVPQVCTVSDINESEYCDKNDEDRKRKVVKKRAPTQNNRKARVREKDYEFYDRDAQYCSQLNINLDCSSTDMMKNFNGDSKRLSNRKKILPNSNKTHTASNDLSDVWAVLRNINRFQFRPSPPLSDEESIVPLKKKVQKKTKKANRKDARVIETCRTQEFAYISSYELDKKSPNNLSPSSSTDRITVIDNQNEFNIICEELEKRLLGPHDFHKDSNNSKNVIQKNKILSKRNVTALGYSGAKDNKQLISLKKKKKNNLTPPAIQQSNSEMTASSNGNKDSLTGTDILLYNDNSFFSHKTEKDNMCPAKVSYVSSDNPELSKAEVHNKINEQVSTYDNYLDVAVLNKEHEGTANIPKLLDPQQRKPRLVTTMPSSCMIPKLTQTEIKRRLAHMRFPIVVLGKDQVDSSIKVMDYDPPQFNGLDDHIWPFMIEWSPNASEDTKYHNNTLNRKYQSYLQDSNSASHIKNKSRKTNTEVVICKQAALKDKRQDTTALKNKAIITPTPISEITDKLIQCTKKQKSIVQLKDKMLNFLYKKSSNRDVSSVCYENYESKPITFNDNSAMAENKVTAITDSQFKPDNVLLLNDRPIKRPFSIEGSYKKAQTYKYPWAKAKWASDFIDNVMKKIRSGVYYSQDLEGLCQTYQIDLQEVSVQAGSYRDNRTTYTAASTQTCEADSTYDGTNDINQNNHISIPGFNNTLPLLEIQTLNMNQITVKHCMTNIMVQFDVTVPAKTDKSTRGLNKTVSLTPIAITNSQTKVYKSKTTIFNAMLPAELCSILPKMMSSIIDSNNSSMGNLTSCLTKTDSCLSTIAELTRSEMGDSMILTSPVIKQILEGRFANIDYKKPKYKNNDFKIKYNDCLVTEMLPMVSSNNLLKYKTSALVVELDNSQYIHSQESLHQPNKQISSVIDTPNHTICTSVQIYTGSKNILTSAFKPNQLAGIMERIIRSHHLQINENLNSYFDMLKLQYNGKNVEINMSMTNYSGDQTKISINVSNLNIDSLYKAIPKIENDKKYQINRNNTPMQCIEYINTSQAIKSQNKVLTQVTLKKAKRKGFYKVYRKCKSTNMPGYISGEKLTNTATTPLNKITTLDDFFQIFGSKKIFSSVFDGNAAKNILSSLMEMKNWISEINPKQALLVLLLTNKKDTQNLVRFRPIILQGIAVNRITRASELDMEIEVIDREKFKPFPQFEGITYLPESATDYENLLDELYWIAKTTASDYNKPFDESSVRLLKSLLQKRKKLNPSYLRVMARYVGLGLVKTPTC